AEDGIRDFHVTGVQTCALPISRLVRVDPELGLARLSRVVGAYDAGRIINPKTARSQAIGGIIWGVGQALLEQSEMDPRSARFLRSEERRVGKEWRCGVVWWEEE